MLAPPPPPAGKGRLQRNAARPWAGRSAGASPGPPPGFAPLGSGRPAQPLCAPPRVRARVCAPARARALRSAARRCQHARCPAQARAGARALARSTCVRSRVADVADAAFSLWPSTPRRRAAEH
eukprot:12869285-Alexandrium_andersonii.AAC.1